MSSFLLVNFIPRNLSPVLTGSRRHNPFHGVQQKELRSASQWFLRGEPLTSCLKLSISASESPNMELLIYPAQVLSRMHTPASSPRGLWPFLIPVSSPPSYMDRLQVRPEFNLMVKPIGRTNGPSWPLRSWQEVLGKEGSFVKSHHRRAVFELSISYSFVYFTCSLTV